MSFLQRIIRNISEQRDRWRYEFFGPATLHIQLELYLLAGMILLTAANLQGLYKDSFGLAGDFTYLLCVTAWLSRYAICRWLCLWDNSTSRSPTIRGFLSCFLASHVFSGQTFDRPSRLAVSKFIAPPTTSQPKSQLALSHFIPSSELYLYQLVKMTIYFPVARLLHLDFTSPPFLELLRPALNATVGMRNASNRLLQYLYGLWAASSPSLSFVVSLSTTAVLALKLFLLCFSGGSSSNADSNLSARPQSPLGKDGGDVLKPYGMYKSMEPPEWSTVMLLIAAFGTLASLLHSFHVILPMPDQVAGGSVIKDIRSELKTMPTTGTKATRRRDQPDWNERPRPAESRMNLLFSVRLIRMLECVFVCGLLPRTRFVCRATGHCGQGGELWQLTKVLYPAGITTPLRRDISFSLDTVASDRFSALYCILGIVLVSLCLQLAQSVLLNKTYLAILAYVSDEWELVEGSDMSAPPPAWDVRRRYKKGDLILYPATGKRQRVYRAVATAPEGKPVDEYFQPEHDLFRTEHGHPATSNLLRRAAGTELLIIGFQFLMWLVAKFAFGYKADGLVTATLAHALAAHALSTLGSVNYNEMSRLAAEISPVH